MIKRSKGQNGEFWGFFRRVWGGRKRLSHISINGLLSIEAFEECIKQERARSYRTGSCFTLLSFSLGPSQGKCVPRTEDLWKLLASIIHDRTRISDIKGLHQGESLRIGIILPDTKRKAAIELVQSIEDIFVERARLMTLRSNSVSELFCEIFTYKNEISDKQLTGEAIRFDSVHSDPKQDSTVSSEIEIKSR